MITLLKDYTCYNADIAAVIVCTQENAQRLKTLMQAVNNQCFPAAEKIVLFDGEVIPDWFARYPDWDYKLCDSSRFDDAFGIIRASVESTWFCLVQKPLLGNCFLRASEKMQSPTSDDIDAICVQGLVLYRSYA